MRKKKLTEPMHPSLFPLFRFQHIFRIVVEVNPTDQQASYETDKKFNVERNMDGVERNKSRQQETYEIRLTFGPKSMQVHMLQRV